MQKDVLFGLSQGTQVLQAIHKEMGGLEGVEKMMGDTEDARAYQEVWIPRFSFLSVRGTLLTCNFLTIIQDVSHMLGGQMSNQDEDEVEDELDLLEQQLRGPVKLPDAPTSSIQENRDRDKEQREKDRAKARTKARAEAAVPLEA